jgi:hypothetical protein
VEILRVGSYDITLQDLAELEHYENLKEVNLQWSQGPSLEKALSKLNRFANWHQLTLTKKDISFVIRRAVQIHNEIETIVIIVPRRNIPYCDRSKPLTDEVGQFVSHRRPRFKFTIAQSRRVPSSLLGLK